MRMKTYLATGNIAMEENGICIRLFQSLPYIIIAFALYYRLHFAFIISVNKKIMSPYFCQHFLSKRVTDLSMRNKLFQKFF